MYEFDDDIFEPVNDDPNDDNFDWGDYSQDPLDYEDINPHDTYDDYDDYDEDDYYDDEDYYDGDYDDF